MRQTEYRRTGAAQPMRTVSRLARRLAAVIAECHYAQQRAMALRVAPDRYLQDPAAGPLSYGDFLFRTSGPLLCEPSAKARAAGRKVAG